MLTRNETELLTASFEGDLNKVNICLLNGANVNVQGGGRGLAIHDGSGFGDVLALWGASPLMWAAFKGHDSIIRRLLQAGAQVNYQIRRNGLTALMMATLMGNQITTQLLIQAGAQVNVQTSNGVSPLMLAAWRGHLEIVKQLFTAGADINMVDNKNRTALSYVGYSLSRSSNSFKIKEFLKTELLANDPANSEIIKNHPDREEIRSALFELDEIGSLNDKARTLTNLYPELAKSINTTCKENTFFKQRKIDNIFDFFSNAKKRKLMLLLPVSADDQSTRFESRQT